jgi:PIN domain
MKVIFDTCALHDDLAMTGLASQTILSQAKQGKFDLVMPEVVFLEVVNKMGERITQASEKMARGASSLKKIGVGTSISSPKDGPLRLQFRTDLRARIEDAGSFVPIPSLDHATLVERAIAGRKPFRSSGVGYRDALIWQTVVEEAQADDVVFVSGNSKDFGEAGSLHADLQADLSQSQHQVSLLDSVEDFIEKFVPAADQAKERASQLIADSDFRENLEETIGALLGDHENWPYHSAITMVPGEPPGMLSEGPHLVGVEPVCFLSLSVDDAMELDQEQGIAVLTLTAKLETMLDLLFDKGDAYWLSESNADISFYEMNFNETYAAGQTDVFVEVELRAVLNDDTEAEETGEDEEAEFEELELVAVKDLSSTDPDHPASQ